MRNIEAYKIRLQWISAVIAETIYQDAPIPGEYPECTNAAVLKVDIQNDAYALGMSMFDPLADKDASIPLMLADVPELKGAWERGYIDADWVPEEDYGAL